MHSARGFVSFFLFFTALNSAYGEYSEEYKLSLISFSFPLLLNIGFIFFIKATLSSAPYHVQHGKQRLAARLVVEKTAPSSAFSSRENSA